MTSYLDYTFSDSPALVETYDELPLWSAPFGLELLKRVELRRGLRVLDLGSGTGFPLLELAQRLGESCRVFGLDPWDNANQRARYKISHYDVHNVEVIQGVGEYLPFGQDRLDLIVSNLGINNWQRPDQVLQECSRVLKAGGRLALTTNLTGHWISFYELFAHTLSELGKADLVAKLAAHEAHRGTVESVSDLLLRNGFQITRQVTDQFEMRFLDGSAFLRHHFIKLGFLGAWKEIVPPAEREEVFGALEMNLNHFAARRGCLELTVPLAYIEGINL